MSISGLATAPPAPAISGGHCWVQASEQRLFASVPAERAVSALKI